MNRHADPPPHATTAPAVPEPTHAESARTLTHLGRTGSLATVSLRHAGHPFASLMPYALDEQGRPLLLISPMAMHT
jgi:putative heme iron utilization protein